MTTRTATIEKVETFDAITRYAHIEWWLTLSAHDTIPERVVRGMRTRKAARERATDLGYEIVSEKGGEARWVGTGR